MLVHGVLEARAYAGAAALVAIILALGASAPATATPVVDLAFVATSGAGVPGAASIAASPGDVVTLELRLRPGPEGVSSYGVSLRFDAGLRNELDVISIHEFRPAGFTSSFTPFALAFQQESSSSGEGRLYTFEAYTTGAGPVAGVLAIGRVEFRVTSAVSGDGPDVEAGLFNAGVDGIFDNGGHDLEPIAHFGTAAVFVPEPATIILVATGLLLIARNRSRSRSS